MSELSDEQIAQAAISSASEKVTISRAKYEALVGAAKQLIFQHRGYYGKSDGRCEACKAIDALRAAGIDPSEERDEDHSHG